MKYVTLFAATAIATAVASGCTMESQRQDEPISGTVGMAQDSASSTDQEFARTAAQGGAAEVQLALLAQQLASSQEVRQYAEQLLADHDLANAQLMQAAQSAGLELPVAPSERHENTIEELSRLSGPQFDQRFMDVQVEEHQQDIALFQDQAQNGQHPDLKEFASNTVPVLQQHLELAQSIQSRQRAMR